MKKSKWSSKIRIYQLFAKTSLALALLFNAAFICAQTIENYEGTPITMNVMTNGAADASTMVKFANPSKTGINTSNNVCKFLRDKDGFVWDGFWSSSKTVDITTNKYVHVKVFKTRISPLKFKLEGGASGTLEIFSKYAQTKINAWEDIVFDFSSKTGTYPTIAFMPDAKDPVGLANDITIYFDEIVINNNPNPINGGGANFTISGNVGVATATLSYSGGSTTADGTGNYSITVASGWSGTVTPSKAQYTFAPTSRSYTNVVANQTGQNYTATFNGGGANATITKLFEGSYEVYKRMRFSNGVYMDNLPLAGGQSGGALNTCGAGLVSLAVADAMYKKTGDAGNWESNAPALVRQTLQTFVNFKNNGRANGAGMFQRYFDWQTGYATGEFSTADNALFAFGIIICKNYFSGDAQIQNLANNLLGSMDFTRAINANNIAMVLDGGVGQSAFTAPWNEYMMVSWLAKNAKTSNPRYNFCQTAFNNNFANPRTSPGPKPSYAGYQTLSDQAAFRSSFTIQFCYYYVHYFKNNPDYMWYFNNFMQADRAYQGGASYEWGLGAGSDPGGAYSVQAVNDNPNNIVGPHIIAGFIPNDPATCKADLLSLYNNNKGVYTLSGGKQVLWKYSRNNPAQLSPTIIGVDFATFMWGIASLPEYLGNNWFATYNNMSNINLARELSLEDISTSLNISAYPNPFENTITITSDCGTDAKVSLTDVTGRIVFSTVQKRGTHTQQVSNLEQGLYLIELKTANHSKRIRVIKK